MAGRIAYYGGIVTDGLVLHLDAAKRDSYPGSGTVWRDLSGNGNNGTLVNGPTFDRDSGNGSLVFDGVNDYGALPYPSLLNFGPEVSFCINARILDLNNFPRLFSNSDVTLTNVYTEGIIFYLRTTSQYGLNSNTLTFQYGRNNWAWNVFASNGITITDNNYHFCAISAKDLNTTSPTIRFYIDNNSIPGTNWTVNNPEPIRYANTINSIRLSSVYTATRPSYNTSYSNVEMSTISIYNRALTPTEISQNYNALKSRFGL